MATDLVKRQHYVPRTYLRYFSQPKGSEFYISSLDKSTPAEENIFGINITNVALAKHLYTLPGNTVEEKMLLEKFYSDEIEVHYNDVHRMLLDPSKTTLTDKERELIISTVVTMFYRTTKWISQHNELMERVFTQMFDLCQQYGKDSFLFEKVRIDIKGKDLQSFLRENKIENQPGQVITQLEVAIKLIQLRSVRDSIYVVELADAESEFITSDNPVICENVKGGHIEPGDPTNILKLPLDSKHMLYLVPYGDASDKNMLVRRKVSGTMCEMEMLTLNYSQFHNAERFILGTDSALREYLKTKEATERPLTNDELEKLNTKQDIISKMKDMGL
jgi:hypothetical protein